MVRHKYTTELKIMSKNDNKIGTNLSKLLKYLDIISQSWDKNIKYKLKEFLKEFNIDTQNITNEDANLTEVEFDQDKNTSDLIIRFKTDIPHRKVLKELITPMMESNQFKIYEIPKNNVNLSLTVVDNENSTKEIISL